jgi:hypothetical protein
MGLKVKSVTFHGHEDVYNIAVDDVHDYAVSYSGIIVKNCYDQL